MYVSLSLSLYIYIYIYYGKRDSRPNIDRASDRDIGREPAEGVGASDARWNR